MTPMMIERAEVILSLLCTRKMFCSRENRIPFKVMIVKNLKKLKLSVGGMSISLLAFKK